MIRSMAKQTRRILKKINTPKLEDEEIPEAQKHKQWENILLVAVICLTLFLLASGWDQIDNLNRGMYIALLVSLLLMYAQRRLDLSPTQLMWFNRFTFAAIGVSIVIFGFVCYFQYFA